MGYLSFFYGNFGKEPNKDVVYTLRRAHQKQAQLIMLADQKAQILSGLVLVVLTLLETRLNYMNTDGLLDGLNVFSVGVLCLFFAAEVIAISLGILVVMPRFPQKMRDQKIEKIQNPLFSLPSLNSKRIPISIMSRKTSSATTRQGDT